METVDEIYFGALIRRTQIGNNIKDILAKEPVNRVKLYDACYDYVKMDNFLEVCEKHMENTEDFDYHCKCGVQCDCGSKGEAKNDDEDDELLLLLPTPKVQTTRKALKINVVQDNDTVDVKVNAGRNGGKLQNLSLDSDQKEKVAALIERGDFEELVELLNEYIDDDDDKAEELRDILDELGTSLKEIRNDSAKKDTRIDKEEKRLNALSKLFECVEKAFSDD